MTLSLEQHSKQFYQYGNRVVEYYLVKSKRRKTCEVTVDRDKITIRVPFDKTLSEVEKILYGKIRWITQKQKEIQSKEPEIIKPSFEYDNSTLPYLGKNYPFRVDHIKNKQEKERIEFQNDEFVVYLNINIDGKDNKPKEKLRSLYHEWLFTQSRILFANKVDKFAKLIDGVEPKRMVVKDLKNRWGSVTKNKTINLNVNLMKAPEDIIDYIIVHELCHFKIKGHSYQFWDYLKQFVPYYEQKTEWLGRNSVSLLS